MFSIVDRYKLWNCAAFGCDDDNGGGGNDNGGSSSSNNNNDSTPTFNSLSEASAAGYHGEAVNITGQGLQRVEFADDNYNQQMANVSAAANTGGGSSNNNNTGGGTTTTSNNNDSPQLSASAQSQVGNVAQDENGNWYAVVQNPNSNTLGRDYSIDPKDNSQGPTFGANVSDNVETLFPDEVAAAGGSSDFQGSITDIFTDTDVDSAGFDPSTGTYTYTPLPPVVPEVAPVSLELPVGGPGTFQVGALPAAPIESVIATGGPGTFNPGALPAAPIQPVTPVSYGEAGRGGPDSAAPGNYTYQPGVDPELEMLVSLKNSGVDLDSDEYLKATAYENEKNASGSPTGGVQVADASGILSTLGEYATDAYNALTFQDPIGEKIKSGVVGIPNELSNMMLGNQQFFQSRPVAFTGNPILDASQEFLLRLQPQATQNMILSETPEQAAERGQFSGAAGRFLGDMGEKLENYFFPDGRDQAVVTGTNPGDLALETVEGQGGYSGLGNVVAEEVGGGLSTDIPLSYLGLPGMTASAMLNFGEQIGGGAANTRQALDVLEQQGILQNNSVYLDALEKQGGDAEAAKDAIARANIYGSAPEIGGTGTFDAFIPAPGKGLIGAGKNLLLRGGVEGGQEVVESMAALDGLNKVLGLQGDQQIQVTKDASGNFVMGVLAGMGTSVAASPFSGLTASQREAVNQDALANDAAMQQAAGTQGVASFAPGPVNQTAVATQPEAMTTSPTVFNPNLSETAGELAQSNVPTAYDIEQDKVAGLLEAPQAPDSSASSLDVMAAQEIIENQIRETGTISPEVMTNLQAATGLSMNDLSSMATNAATGTLGSQSFPINVGSETPSDLIDQPTGIGGGGNIGVETLPNGDTLLRNNETGRTTVVDKGENLANAIQVFDEVTTPFGAPEIDTTPVALPPFNVAGAPAQPVLPAGTDTSPVMPSAPKAPNIPDIDVAGLGSLQPDSLPNVDTSSLPDGIAAAQDNNPNQEEDLEAGIKAALDAAGPPNTATISDAIDLVNTTGKATPSHLQRNLGITYSQASDLVDQMQNQGLVSEANYVGNRTVNTDAVTMAAAAAQNNEGEGGDTTVEVPATTDGDTLPATAGTEVVIDDDGSSNEVGGLEGEILGPEISTEVNPEEDTSVTIDMEATPETDTTSEIGTDTIVSLPSTDTTTDTDSTIPTVTRTATTDTAVDQTIKPLTEVGEFPEPIEEIDPEEPVVVEIDDGDDVLVSQITTTDKDGNTITECPEGYREVQTPDGIMCEKITTTSTTTGRRTYGVGRTATTGLAGNIGRETPRSRTRTRTSTSTSRVKPTTRSA